jgi:hypothetical protein
MKKLLVSALVALMAVPLIAQVALDYYLPHNVEYNGQIPKPESVVGHQVGEWLITHDKLIQYMQAIAASSDRVTLKVYGYSYEDRPLVHLIFSSPNNLNRLDELKAQHQQLTDPSASGHLDIDQMPLVVTLGYSVHGNETSGSNAALVTAYYLAAAEGPEIDALLDNNIIIVDPCLNPDGLTRFATWGNMHKGQVVSPDDINRGFDEVWPGGRTNHYWYDLNRDYVLLVNPETRGRVEQIHEWKPNIMTDHHEMGSNSTFFFQPGVPSRNNPLTPGENYELTRAIGSYHAKALDDLGSYYFSEEVFDDFYLGKGSSYPDINGGIGILFEQASVRGFERETETGIITFPFAIRNQFTVTLSTLQAAMDLKTRLLEYMRNFYRSAIESAASDPVKAYVLGTPDDKGRTRAFLQVLMGHDIDFYQLRTPFAHDQHQFGSDHAYVVPLKQKQYRLIKALFEPVSEFNDSTFYDVSTWTLPLSFNMPCAPVTSAKVLSDLMGQKVTKPESPAGLMAGDSDPVAWAFRWDDYYAPRVLSKVLSEGLIARVATLPFEYHDEPFPASFDYGTIIVPAHQQLMEPDEIGELLQRMTVETGIDIYALGTGWSSTGIDLGSSSFRNVRKPKILMLIGEGISSRDAGEIWHLFDTRYHTAITMAEANRLSRVELSDYSTIIIPGGSPYGMAGSGVERLNGWIRNGGTLVVYKNSSQWAVSNDLLKMDFKPGASSLDAKVYPYAERYKAYSAQSISGAIFEVQLDLTHPMAYGYSSSRIPVFKSGSTVAEPPDDPYQVPIRYTQDPLISGFASKENIQRIKGAPFLVTQGLGRGSIIAILDNTNFRGAWFGTNKIFANAVFFGDLVGGSSRYYE